MNPAHKVMRVSIMKAIYIATARFGIRRQNTTIHLLFKKSLVHLGTRAGMTVHAGASRVPSAAPAGRPIRKSKLRCSFLFLAAGDRRI
jgi:hypothetical protein